MSGRTTIACPLCGHDDNDVTAWIFKGTHKDETAILDFHPEDGFVPQTLVGQVVHCNACENVWEDYNHD